MLGTRGGRKLMKQPYTLLLGPDFIDFVRLYSQFIVDQNKTFCNYTTKSLVKVDKKGDK